MSYLNITSPWNRQKIKTAEELWSLFMNYTKHSDDNPMVEAKLFNAKDGLRDGELDHIRPYTLEGFLNFVGMHKGTWNEWKKRYEEEPFFVDTMIQIESIVEDQMFQGAMGGFFNPSLASRKLGLAERQELTGANGGPIETEEVTARERVSRRIAGLASRTGANSSIDEPDGSST